MKTPSLKTLALAALLGTLALGPARADLLSRSAAPPPIETWTPASSVPSLASLKKYYDIPNFRIGGPHDLDAP